MEERTMKYIIAEGCVLSEQPADRSESKAVHFLTLKTGRPPAIGTFHLLELTYNFHNMTRRLGARLS